MDVNIAGKNELTEPQFRVLAIRTESPQFNEVPLHVVRAVFIMVTDAVKAVDLLKKAFFYDPDRVNNRVWELEGMDIMEPYLDYENTPSEEIYNPVHTLARSNNPTYKGRLTHGIIGKFTEAGELMEALAQSIVHSKPLDRINIEEELGDDQWYNALIMTALELYNFNGVRYAVIEKLKTRYPEKFENIQAEIRDLASERDRLTKSIQGRLDQIEGYLNELNKQDEGKTSTDAPQSGNVDS